MEARRRRASQQLISATGHAAAFQMKAAVFHEYRFDLNFAAAGGDQERAVKSGRLFWGHL
jgi:hypothetical protein